MHNQGNFYNSIYHELDVQAFMAIDALHQAKTHLDKYRQLSESINSIRIEDLQLLNLKEATNEAHRFFRNIHSFIVCHGNLSKLLSWNGGRNDQYKFPGNQEEKDSLCKKLKELKSGLQSFDDRDLRNHLEHYDERIIFSAYKGDISFFSICSSNQRVSSNSVLKNKVFMREFIIDKKIYSFKGDDFNIEDMEQDVYVLQKRLYTLPDFLKS